MEDNFFLDPQFLFWPFSVIVIFIFATYFKDPEIWSFLSLLLTLIYGILVYSRQYGIEFQSIFSKKGDEFYIPISIVVVFVVLFVINLLAGLSMLKYFNIYNRVWLEIISTLVVLITFILIDYYILQKKKRDHICGFDFLIVCSNILSLIGFFMIIVYMLINNVPMVDIDNGVEVISSVWIGAATYALISSNIFFSLLIFCQNQKRKEDECASNAP